MLECQYLAYGTAVTSEQCQYQHPAQLRRLNKFKLILGHSNTKFHTHYSIIKNRRQKSGMRKQKYSKILVLTMLKVQLN